MRSCTSIGRAASGAHCRTTFLTEKTVYNLFWQWRNDGVWQNIHDALREQLRKTEGKRKTPTAAIIDSQTVKTTEVGGPERDYDGGQKISGRKRHIVVDTLGLILAVVVHGANRQDYDGAPLVIQALRVKLKRIKVIFADSAYGRNNLPLFTKQNSGMAIEVVRRPHGMEGFQVLSKRWVSADIRVAWPLPSAQ